MSVCLYLKENISPIDSGQRNFSQKRMISREFLSVLVWARGRIDFTGKADFCREAIGACIDFYIFSIDFYNALAHRVHGVYVL